MEITYQIENDLSSDEFKTILINSTLAERRPVTDDKRMELMIKNSNLIVTARHNDKLVGIARSVSDHSYCTYLSDLAVDKSYQKKGIGKELIEFTKNEMPKALLILLAAPQAINYYPKIGMTKHHHCYVL